MDKENEKCFCAHITQFPLLRYKMYLQLQHGETYAVLSYLKVSAFFFFFFLVLECIILPSAQYLFARNHKKPSGIHPVKEVWRELLCPPRLGHNAGLADTFEKQGSVSMSLSPLHNL